MKKCIIYQITYYRRAYAEEKRPPKRLFTPEIKRYLKDWLVRRRDNPYPSRDEKKILAIETGLTYIQVIQFIKIIIISKLYIYLTFELIKGKNDMLDASAIVQLCN